MSEYKTLKELLGDATESKGRKFIDEVGLVFEPKFLLNTKWYGVNQQHENVIAMSESMYRWEEWQPPKKTKKVTLYRPVYLGYEKTYCSRASVGWHSDKGNWDGCRDEIVGWMTMEVEVDDEN